MIQIGQSSEGRPILLAKLSINEGFKKPAIFIEAGTNCFFKNKYSKNSKELHFNPKFYSENIS